MPAALCHAVAIGFVAVGAVGFHRLDAVPNVNLDELRPNRLPNLTGPMRITACGLLLLRFAGERPVFAA
jgi:hypothetical protein